MPSNPALIVVPLGSSAAEIASKIYDSGVISSPKIFLLAVKLSGNTHKLKAGTYLISPRKSVFSVIGILTRGQSQSIKVTIPEGFTAKQIAGTLSSFGIVQEQRFLELVYERKLEGYLFPETYFFEGNTNEEKVITRMTDEFNRNFSPEMKQRAKELKTSERSTVILASLIEKEAAGPGDMAHISAVFHNRLKKYWYLESCATVLYALGKHKEKLTYKDLKVSSPYNTYINFGLPAGPICNPGKKSLLAALYPDKSDDMFFVVNGSGTHTFSRYYAEHLKNKKKRSGLNKNTERVKE